MKFKYLDRVVIPKGFYEGERGVAIGYRRIFEPAVFGNFGALLEEYEIELDRYALRVWISGKELEKSI